MEIRDPDSHQHHSPLSESFPDATKVKRSLRVKVIKKTDRQTETCSTMQEWDCSLWFTSSLPWMPGKLNKIRIQVVSSIFTTHRNDQRHLNRERLMCSNFKATAYRKTRLRQCRLCGHRHTQNMHGRKPRDRDKSQAWTEVCVNLHACSNV